MENEKTVVNNAKDMLDQVIQLSNSVSDLKQENKNKDKEIYRLQKIADKKENNDINVNLLIDIVRDILNTVYEDLTLKSYEENKGKINSLLVIFKHLRLIKNNINPVHDDNGKKDAYSNEFVHLKDQMFKIYSTTRKIDNMTFSSKDEKIVMLEDILSIIRRTSKYTIKEIVE